MRKEKQRLVESQVVKSEIVEQLGRAVWKMVCLLAGGERSSISQNMVLEIVREAVSVADLQYGMEEAREWAGDFQIPADVVKQHEAEFRQCGCDLKKLGFKRKEALSGQRLSVARAERLSNTNPQKPKVLELASGGMPVFVEPDFIPNGLTVHGRFPKNA